MSALALYVETNGVTFAADAAAYDMQGKVTWFRSKIHILERQQCVIGNVGIWSFADTFKAIAQARCSNFDSIADDFVEIGRDAYQASSTLWREHGTQIPPPRGTIAIGGWSRKRARFEALKLHSEAKEVLDKDGVSVNLAQPWTAIPIDEFWCSSRPTHESMDRLGVTSGLPMPAEELIGRTVCALRRESSDRGDGVYGVGGWLDIVAIREAGISSWRPHVWPDKVGEPIDPTRGEELPATFLIPPETMTLPILE